jgi:hypothetical protein
MEPQIKMRNNLLFLIFCLLITSFASSCAMVPQMDREDLSDPLMQVDLPGPENKIQAENFPRREGATGGDSGSGGGCGC